MHKRSVSFLAISSGLGLMSLNHYALAAELNAVLPTNDSAGCTALIKRGDADLPSPTSNLTGLQSCLSSCDQMYRSLGDQGRLRDMLQGVSYCRKTLNNLYFASIYKSNRDKLIEESQQQQQTNPADNPMSVFEKLNALIRQKAEPQNQRAKLKSPRLLIRRLQLITTQTQIKTILQTSTGFNNEKRENII